MNNNDNNYDYKNNTSDRNRNTFEGVSLPTIVHIEDN